MISSKSIIYRCFSLKHHNSLVIFNYHVWPEGSYYHLCKVQELLDIAQDEMLKVSASNTYHWISRRVTHISQVPKSVSRIFQDAPWYSPRISRLRTLRSYFEVGVNNKRHVEKPMVSVVGPFLLEFAAGVGCGWINSQSLGTQTWLAGRSFIDIYRWFPHENLPLFKLGLPSLTCLMTR